MPHIFRFHEGHITDILDWKRSDRISSSDVQKVTDKTNEVTSSAGSSIPTPIARMFLFKTAFELMDPQKNNEKDANKGIYAALVSDALDLLELLFKGGSNPNQFRYERWTFDSDNRQFFGKEQAHELLSESFRQAAAQNPFNNRLEITLIYYKEGNKEVLIGGTSPFTVVFTSPNFNRKRLEKGIKNIDGLSSSQPLFTNNPRALYERDSSFIWFIENLIKEVTKRSFDAFKTYVIHTRKQFESQHSLRFASDPVALQDIQYGSDIPLSVSGVHIQQISERDYQLKINKYSDFKLDLPADSPYGIKEVTPLLLFSGMVQEGQYTTPSNLWSNKIVINALFYPQTTVKELFTRELPGIKGIKYPFVSKFDFFEKSLVMLPDYVLDEERFVTLIENQDFILPIKPLFFQFFPLEKLSDYVKITRNLVKVGAEPEISVQITIPITGPSMGKRKVTLTQVYKKAPVAGLDEDRDKFPFAQYSGILGITPFTKTKATELNFINNYTVASYEKTNGINPLASVKFFKNTGTEPLNALLIQRSDYKDANTKTSYLQVKESFDIIQLNFNINSAVQGGLIIPKFKAVINGTNEYVYAVDFGTSNTHVEYSLIENKNAVSVKPLEINEVGMIMTMLNKPTNIGAQDGYPNYNDYTRFGKIVDSVKAISLREFMPFQIGSQKAATTKFPFRTATYESRNFQESRQPQLFVDANIGFNIDKDILTNNQGYQTNIKWQLEDGINDVLKQDRIKIFFRQLLYIIRGHALLSTTPPSDLNLLKIAMSYPISMENDLKKDMIRYFTEEMNTVFGIRTDRSEGNHEADSGNPRLIEVTESIAPYYQLLKENSNIKHDIYCNIDVGGGTSDIVLVDKSDRDKLLNCYCNSVRFAGKQLWGSISDDYNPEDNGFVLFYLKQLQLQSRNEYDKLNAMIEAKNNRTEDIVSYLFSDDSLNFKQIFTECKELKVPLLLHYTAILYFVAKSCKLKSIRLPKTLSFSGKGSEYISVIFESDDYLSQYTKQALTLFSGLEADPAFNAKKSRNPKVITAQGSVIYGANPLARMEKNIFGEDLNTSDELLINPVPDKYYGLLDKDIQQNDKKLYGDFQEHEPGYESVMLNCVEFLETFFGDAKLIGGGENSLNIDDLGKYKSFFIDPERPAEVLKSGVLRNSYKSALEGKDLRKEATDSPFFFAFNTSLIALSKHIATGVLKTKNQI